MENILNEIILENWGGIRLNANIDEELEDIVLAIQYDDHGDDFLLVKTKEKFYEYGWWLNRERHFYPRYDELYNGRCDWQKWFVRRPELFYRFDNRCEFSNEISFRIARDFEKDYWRGRNLNDTTIVAQYKFDKIIEYLEEVSHRGITYDFSNSYSKYEISRYLKEHNIDTKENIDKLENAKWSSRINGSDGIAGKRIYDGYYRLHGDNIKFIYYKGKLLALDKVKMKHDWDEWGTEMFSLSLKQFK